MSLFIGEDTFDRPLPNHCKQCGGSMVKGKVNMSNGSFDSRTGQFTGKAEYRLRCERQVGLKNKLFRYFEYHDDFLVIDDPTNKIFGDKPHRTFLEYF